MRNKKIKQSIVDVVLQGRRAIWFGEETEVFAAISHSQLEDEFGPAADYEKDDNENVISKDWRYWWKPIASEKQFSEGRFITKGSKVYSKKGELIEYLEKLPLICGVHGNRYTISQVSTTDQ